MNRVELKQNNQGLTYIIEVKIRIIRIEREDVVRSVHVGQAEWFIGVDLATVDDDHFLQSKINQNSDNTIKLDANTSSGTSPLPVCRCSIYFTTLMPL